MLLHKHIYSRSVTEEEARALVARCRRDGCLRLANDSGLREVRLLLKQKPATIYSILRRALHVP